MTTVWRDAPDEVDPTVLLLGGFLTSPPLYIPMRRRLLDRGAAEVVVAPVWLPDWLIAAQRGLGPILTRSGKALLRASELAAGSETERRSAAPRGRALGRWVDGTPAHVAGAVRGPPARCGAAHRRDRHARHAPPRDADGHLSAGDSPTRPRTSPIASSPGRRSPRRRATSPSRRGGDRATRATGARASRTGCTDPSTPTSCPTTSTAKAASWVTASSRSRRPDWPASRRSCSTGSFTARPARALVRLGRGARRLVATRGRGVASCPEGAGGGAHAIVEVAGWSSGSSSGS